MPAAAEAVLWALWHLRPLQSEVLCRWCHTQRGWTRSAPCQLEPIIPPDGGTSSMVSSQFSFHWTLLTTDASQSNWELIEQIPVQGTWCSGERLMSPNLRDLRTIRLAPQLLPLSRGKAVTGQTKSLTAVLSIIKQGSTRSSPLLREVGMITNGQKATSPICQQSTYVALNMVADCLS